MNLILDMYGAHIEGDNEHPQEIMKKLGIAYYHATPQSIADCWWFWCCENVPNDLPSYFRELQSKPMECIGYGLSEEMAISIKKRMEELNGSKK